MLVLFGLLLALYEGYFMVRSDGDRPLLFNRIRDHILIIRYVLAYGSLIGILIKYNWKYAIVTFIIYYLINTILSRHFFKQQLAIEYDIMFNYLKDERNKSGEQISNEDISMNAYEMAKNIIINRIKGKSY